MATIFGFPLDGIVTMLVLSERSLVVTTSCCAYATTVAAIAIAIVAIVTSVLIECGVLLLEQEFRYEHLVGDDDGVAAAAAAEGGVTGGAHHAVFVIVVERIGRLMFRCERNRR